MPVKRKFAYPGIAALCLVATGAVSQAPSQVTSEARQPLSAIDWLDETAQVIEPIFPGPPGTIVEPPVTGGVRIPDVSVVPLGENEGQEAVGLLASHVTGLPETLWSASDVQALERLISRADFHAVPSLQELLFTLMLAEVTPPPGADAESFLTIRAGKLSEFGVIEAADAMVERLPLKNGAHFDLWFDLTLLSGLEDKACDRLSAVRGLSEDYAAQIFCAMRAGDWAEASLLLKAAGALELVSRSEHRLLSAFLDPELAESSVALAPPRKISPLEFRLHEAIGNPLPTASLPIRFAVADLRDLAGWKAQLEAAERLAGVKALSPNHLLGLYTARKPAASGGVWERARAIQTLDRNLERGSSAEIGAALLEARQRLAAVGLEHVLAAIYVPEIQMDRLGAEAARAHFELALLTKDYERAKAPSAVQEPRARFLESLAQGAPRGAEKLGDPLASAIEAGFTDASPQAHLAALMESGKLGEAILTAAGDMARGIDGDWPAMKSAIAALRSMGLENVSRRAALEMLILRRGG